METGPFEDVFLIRNMGIFQPGMLVYQEGSWKILKASEVNPSEVCPCTRKHLGHPPHWAEKSRRLWSVQANDWGDGNVREHRRHPQRQGSHREDMQYRFQVLDQDIPEGTLGEELLTMHLDISAFQEFVRNEPLSSARGSAGRVERHDTVVATCIASTNQPLNSQSPQTYARVEDFITPVFQSYLLRFVVSGMFWGSSPTSSTRCLQA